jgi:hypothetical protein
MSEAITEMILPGTYIEVRAEGLIGVGGIATGNIGVVGTASRGALEEVAILGSPGDALGAFGAYDAWQTDGSDPPLSLTRTIEQLFKGGASTVYAVRIANGDPASATWTVRSTEVGNPALFTLTASSPGSWANALEINLTEDSGTYTLELVSGGNKESFTGTNAGELYDAINESKRLVVASGLAQADRTKAMQEPPAALATTATGGPDGAAASATDIARGLSMLTTQPVNILVVAGLDVSEVGATVLAHLEATENDGRERIAVLGASSDNVSDIVADDASAVSNKRVILVAPGIKANDAARTGPNRQVSLPASYAAALVAGRLSTLAPHISLTNKDVFADGLTREYTRAEQKQLLTNRVMVLHKNLGIRALKGITTDDGPFKQISVRRIVDYAKAGVRIGANPYIGRLNNVRVRSALKATLDGFLSGMVQDEMLIGYTLDVGATRAQEIAGQAVVVMTLQPTFSIDFVKVIINLE